MSINTSEGNTRYLNIIKSFAEEVNHLADEKNSVTLKNESNFMKEYLYKVAERYGAGSIFPMASEKIIEIVNDEFNGNLKVESKANQDISDGTDVKTAFVQTYQNSYYSSVGGLKGKLNGIRAIVIYDKKDKLKFRYLVIPTECIENENGERQDSINISFDKDGEISLDSLYWSAQCTFYEYCMLPESAFIHNYRKNEEIRKSKLNQRKIQVFEETKKCLFENKCSLTYLFENQLVESAQAFYNTKECNNEFKNFTDEQISELSEISSEMQELKREEEKTKIYNELLELCSSNNPTSIVELLTLYFEDKKKASNSSWFSSYDGYYFGDERTQRIKDILAENKEHAKIKQFKKLRTLIREYHITSLTELEKEKIFPVSRLRKNYDNGSYYFEKVVPNWKEQIDNLFTENKR